MDIKLTKWDNSYGIKHPKAIIDDLNINKNDSLSIETKNNQIILKKNDYGKIVLKDYAKKHYGKSFNKVKNVLANEQMDWVKSMGDEVW